MKLSVFGMGHLGCVTAACFAAKGHSVIGFDTDEEKLSILKAGRSPFFEAGLDDLLSKCLQENLFSVTQDPEYAVVNSDVTFLCVGTPSLENGRPDISMLEGALQQVLGCIAKKQTFHVISFRSTFLPGTINSFLPALEKYPMIIGEDIGFIHNPDFTREGNAIKDFLQSQRIVIGSSDEKAAATMERVYASFPGKIIQTDLASAEMVKYVDNAFHALKIDFANEVGTLCKAEGLDPRMIMEMFYLDTRLNISTAYLKPGNSFGGSCLNKDIRALIYRASELSLSLPLLTAIPKSNEAHKLRLCQLVSSFQKKRITLLGASFKDNTGDLRESPSVDLAKYLVNVGCEVSVYDKDVSLYKLTSSKEDEFIPSLLCEDLESAVAGAEVVVVLKKDLAYRNVLHALDEKQILVDTVGIMEVKTSRGNYHGISW